MGMRLLFEEKKSGKSVALCPERFYNGHINAKEWLL